MPKHIGSVCDYLDERDSFLLSVYREAISSCDVIRVKDIMRYVVKHPAPRFWCSESQAACEITKRLNGTPSDKVPYIERKRMYDAIFDRFVIARAKDSSASLTRLAFDIVHSPAPESYISSDSAKVLINRYRKKIRNKKNEILFSDSEHGSHSSVLRSARADGDEVRGQRLFDMDNEDNIPVPPCQRNPPSNKCVCHPSPVVPFRSKALAVHPVVHDSIAYTKFYNKRFTNVRFVSSQLCIDWNAPYE